jgi:hypothetical protein
MKAKALILALLASVSFGASGQSREPALPEVLVYKQASCGCCKQWVKHLQKSGFSVRVHDIRDLQAIKKRVGVPVRLESCHTAEVGGYFVEGHVPAQDIERLLRQRSAAKGLAVPRMPAGSPGMEVPSGKVEPYDVLLVGRDGRSSVFSRHGH